MAVGPMTGLQMFEKLMKDTYECKVDCIGKGNKDEKQLRVLGRVVSIGDAGVSYEPDQRHVEAVCQHLGIEAGNSCVTLGKERRYRRVKLLRIVPSDWAIRLSTTMGRTSRISTMS